MLWHIYEQRDDFGAHDEEKLIGVFSSEKPHRKRQNICTARRGFENSL